jgi:phage shock protein B
MEDFMGLMVAILVLLIGLVGMILHYVTKWKTSATLTNDDELMLEELYQVARRLDERMDTVERLLAADSPDFRPGRFRADLEPDNLPLDELDRLRTNKGRTTR